MPKWCPSTTQQHTQFYFVDYGILRETLQVKALRQKKKIFLKFKYWNIHVQQ